MRRASRPLAAIAATMVVALAVGCERVSQSPPEQGAAAATIVATADFGSEALLDVRVAPDQTVMRALRGATEVRSEYGGGFVAEMLGHRSDAGTRRDWFFWVDGLFAEVGAASGRSRMGRRSGGTTIAGTGSEARWPSSDSGRHRSPDARSTPTRHSRGCWPTRVRGRSMDPRSGACAWTTTRTWRAASGPGRARRATPRPSASRRGSTTAGSSSSAPMAPGPPSRRRRARGGGPIGVRPADGVLLAVAGIDDAAADAAARRIAAQPDVLRLRTSVVFDADGAPLTHGGATR